jgi:hypothetical protein
VEPVAVSAGNAANGGLGATEERRGGKDGGAYQDLTALVVVEAVEGGEHAKAAAAVADDEADGAAPSEASLAGRVLGGDVEVLVEVALDAPAPARRLHAAASPRLAALAPLLSRGVLFV